MKKVQAYTGTDVVDFDEKKVNLALRYIKTDACAELKLTES